MQRLGQRLRRVLAHLTRSKARVAWLLVAICAAVYATVHEDTVRQIALIMASVAAGAIFLPELSSDLWTMRADEIRRTVPEQQIAQLQRELVAAAVNDLDWSLCVWSEGVSPMLAAVREPLQVQWHLTYDIRVHLDQTVTIAGHPSKIHRLDSLCRSERLLPPSRDSRIWISLARTHDALMGEFGSPGCLLRELVELPDLPAEKWREAMLGLCHLNLTIDGRTVPLEIAAPDNLDTVRWEASLTDEDFSGGRVPVTVAVSFPLSPDVTNFPIIFASYYCAGRTEVSFAVHHATDMVNLDFINYCSRRAGGTRSHGLVRRTVDDGRLASVSFATAKDSILWPGSGLLFQWNTRSNE